MSSEPEPSEAERVRGDVTRARRNLAIIFVVGIVGFAYSIVFVMRHLPEGHLATEEMRAAVPGANYEPRPAKTCRRFGDSCEFAPGKLGACVQREGCTGDGCLFCQSQH